MDTKVWEVFKSFKEYLSSLSTLHKSEPRRSLYLYLLVSNTAIASPLIREDAKQQHPIYFVSKALQGPEIHYKKLEKVTFALVVTARCLR